ncbi:MAG TPA: alpha/beta hydrolase [Xanthobacteraceae bacterium]|jgi:hypothetical protein|nr:alpha/beta hydrolase [Xanthobacteraceae bacterium]
MTLGGTVMVVTAALVVAGGASCLSLLNNNVKSPEAIGGGQSVVYKTESASELKSNKWETAETAFAALANSDPGGQAAAGGGAYQVASLQMNDQRPAARPAGSDRKNFPLYRFTDDSSVLTIDHAPRETNSFPMRSAQKLAYVTERNSALDQGRLENTLRAQQIRPQSLPVKEPLTKLVEFDGAPFPYDGGGRSYHDNRVLLHIPKGFDARRPAVMVLFFHGHRATLERDVRDRQLVPEQISASGMNAVLVAPQFAVDAADSSVGRFSQPGAVARFVAEAADKLARLHGDPLTAKAFANMRIIIVGYSGGFMPTAYSLYNGGLKNRVRGVVLLDGVYGQLDKFASWIENNRSSFFISSYTHSTKRHNEELERILTEHDVPFTRDINPDLGRGGVAFISADVPHRDYVTHAWVDYPIKDIVSRLGDYQLPTTPNAVAQYDANARR